METEYRTYFGASHVEYHEFCFGAEVREAGSGSKMQTSIHRQLLSAPLWHFGTEACQYVCHDRLSSELRTAGSGEFLSNMYG